MFVSPFSEILRKNGDPEFATALERARAFYIDASRNLFLTQDNVPEPTSGYVLVCPSVSAYGNGETESAAFCVGGRKGVLFTAVDRHLTGAAYSFLVEVEFISDPAATPTTTKVRAWSSSGSPTGVGPGPRATSLHVNDGVVSFRTDIGWVFPYFRETHEFVGIPFSDAA